MALACIYFERLCMKGVGTKPNRKLSMACCLLIAYKFNEPMGGSYFFTKLESLMRFVDAEFEIAKADVFKAELGVLIYLDFALHVPFQHVLEVFKRLLRLVHRTLT